MEELLKKIFQGPWFCDLLVVVAVVGGIALFFRELGLEAFPPEPKKESIRSSSDDANHELETLVASKPIGTEPLPKPKKESTRSSSDNAKHELETLVASKPIGTEPLQRFRCKGLVLRQVEIHEDTTRKDGRRISQLYSDGGSQDVFAVRVKRIGYVAYVEGGHIGEETRYYPDSGRLEFWDNNEKIPAAFFGECRSYGQARKATGIVQALKTQRFSRTDKYWIRVMPTITGPFTVDVEIQTNIPGDARFALDLSLSGQGDYDTFIGTEFMDVPIVNGIGRATIDGTNPKKVMPFGSQLPDGKYDVCASFHPGWDENEARASKLGINDKIESKATVNLKGSGTTAESAKLRENGQTWVMLNWKPGMPWDPNLWKSKFGSWQELEYRGSLNPKILKMYYFETIDMTIMVNVLKTEIVTFRRGAEHK